MAQSRQRRSQRRKQQLHHRPLVTATVAAPRSRNLRRIVIAFLVLVGLAGILAVSGPSDDPSGAPVPVYERR
jgi:hypothetical protein